MHGFNETEWQDRNELENEEGEQDHHRELVAAPCFLNNPDLPLKAWNGADYR